MSRLGTDARHRSIGMIQAGTPQRDVALRFSVHGKPLLLFGDVFRPQEVEVTDHGLGVHVWRHRGKTNTSGWRTCAITSRSLVSLHEPFQGCAVYTPGLCATFCVDTTLAPVDPACARFCCHAMVLNVYGGHMPIWGGVWENGKLYCSQMNLDLVWIIQMVGLWCTTGWASVTKMHAFDRDVRLAVRVWWCSVASQPTVGHPWSLSVILMAIWMHTATWRRLLDRTCCPSSVVREGTWSFSRTMLDHALRVSSWIFSDMRMCCWWFRPRYPPICRQSSTCGTKWTDGWSNDQTSPSRC